MNKTLIFRKIGGIITEITEQYQYLAENPENINPLELELFIANSHFLAEHLAILKKLDGYPGLLQEHNPVSSDSAPQIILQADDQPQAIELNEERNTTAVLSEINNAELPVDPGVPEKNLQNRPLEAAEFPRHEKEAEPVLNQIVTPVQPPKEDILQQQASLKTAEPELAEKAHQVEIPQYNGPAITAPAAEEKVPTLNEMLSAGKSNENVAAKINRFEGKDLKSMISLNDKLMFVRDLFSGYSLAYSEAIDLVNRCSSFEEAETFLKNTYAGKNRWAEKQATVDQFFEILNRRFS